MVTSTEKFEIKTSTPNDSCERGATLLVFSDDWGRHPSSCQHLMRQLLDRYNVIWVNTIGTRAPRLDMATFWRAVGKLKSWVGPSASEGEKQDDVQLQASPKVTSPRMWPWFTKSIDRRINKAALSRQLTKVLQDVQQPAVAVTTLPITADLVGEIPVDKWVYYCVDDFSEWPGLDGSTLKLMDELMLARADKVVAVSDRLQEIAREAGRESELLTHGVDIDFWRSGVRSDVFADVDGPVALFWGVVDQRMDVPTVKRLVERMNGGAVMFYGPQQDPHPELLAMERCHFPGPVPFKELPSLAASADVLIMPYADLPVTRAMQPLKLKEYLASGQPTVVNRLPAVKSITEQMDVADSPDAFASLVLERIDSGTPQNQVDARVSLEAESWKAKANQLEGWIMEGVES
ncbi:MAG: glycosyltransferase [Planctomycetaceae bacterium]